MFYCFTINFFDIFVSQFIDVAVVTARAALSPFEASQIFRPRSDRILFFVILLLFLYQIQPATAKPCQCPANRAPRPQKFHICPFAVDDNTLL